MNTETDKTFVLHTYDRQYVEFSHGRNATLFDTEGRDFIDFTSGIGVTSVGHGNPDLANVICEQARSVIHVSNLFHIEPQARLAKRIVEKSGMDARVFFGNSGAEANEAAIKIARRWGETRGRYKIITLKHSFHGRTIATLAATGQDKMHESFGPFPDGFVYADSIKQAMDMCDETTAAIMLELVQGEGGVQPMDRDDVIQLFDFLNKNEILSIVDEVQTGVYRTGKFLASQVYGVTPDVVTLAKGLAGGVPIGVVMTGLKDVFKPGDHGSTFGGNFLATMAGLKVMDILDDLDKSGALNRTIRYFDEKNAELVKKYPELFTERVGLGLMMGFRMPDDDTVKRLRASCFDNGLLVLKSGRATLRFLPPLTITNDEIDEGFRRLDKAVAGM